ncbi:MAG: hypothetical protein WCS92_05855, partial [Candidatus Babeliales bacterium]
MNKRNKFYPRILLQTTQYISTPKMSMSVVKKGAAECAGSRLNRSRTSGIKVPSVIEVTIIRNSDSVMA